MRGRFTVMEGMTVKHELLCPYPPIKPMTPSLAPWRGPGRVVRGCHTWHHHALRVVSRLTPFVAATQ